MDKEGLKAPNNAGVRCLTTQKGRGQQGRTLCHQYGSATVQEVSERELYIPNKNQSGKTRSVLFSNCHYPAGF